MQKLNNNKAFNLILTRVKELLDQSFYKLSSKFKKNNTTGTVSLKEWIGKPEAAQSGKSNSRVRKKLKLKEVIWLLSQMAKSYSVGIALNKTLNSIVNSTASSTIKKKVEQLRDSTNDGVILSNAIQMHIPEVGPLTIALIKAGEKSGSMSNSLKQSVEIAESRARTRRKLRGALTYPVMVLLIAIAMIIVLMFVVVPKFKEIYASSGAQLPSITRLTISIANKMPFILAIMVAVIAVFVYIFKRSKTDLKLGLLIDSIKLRTPVIGSYMSKNALARISQSLATLIGSNIPLPEALLLAAQSAGSIPHSNALLDARNNIINEGLKLSDALSKSVLFPALFIDIIILAEETATLSQSMDHFAKESLEELEVATKNITDMIEPLMMVVVGLVVGFFVFAMYMPIFSLSQTISG